MLYKHVSMVDMVSYYLHFNFPQSPASQIEDLMNIHSELYIKTALGEL